MYKRALIFPLLLTILVLFGGCGYKPTVTYAQKSLNGKVFVSVDIDIKNINNTILIKDALIEMLTSKFDLTVTTNKALASSYIHGKLGSITETQLQSDVQGYSKVYRESVSVTVTYQKKGESKKTLTEKSYADFSVEDDSVVSQSKKDEAIKVAISKALSNIFSKMAVNSSK